MLKLTIPGLGEVAWAYLLLDVNGTLAADGALLEGVSERLKRLQSLLDVRLVSANAHGNGEHLAQALKGQWVPVDSGQEAEQKRALVMSLGSSQVIAIGNGSNDALMLAAADLGIVVLGPEGTSVRALRQADVIAPSIQVALDLLIYPQRLVGTLRC